MPTFTAKNSRINLTLFGIPDGETSNAYILELTCDYDIDLEEEGRLTGSKLVQGIPWDVEVDESGYANISSYLAEYINSLGSLCCTIADE